MIPTQWRAFVRKEIVLFVQYFLISFLAASVAYSVFEMRVRQDRPMPWDNQVYDIHPFALLRKMVQEFYSPWFLTFLGLAAARFLGVLLVRWYASRRADSSAS